MITYLCAGDPSSSVSLTMFKAIQRAGVDVIEVGIPFSDPTADGPTIQSAGMRALANGITVAKTLELIAQLTKNTPTPIVVMTYLNPLLAYGLEQFFHDASKVGVRGVIVVDLPLEEQAPVRRYSDAHSIDIIQLLPPNCPPQRMRDLFANASGFVYHVSVKGITGQQSANLEKLQAFLTMARQHSALPIVTGFGIKTDDHVRHIAQMCDGVVVGSALIDIIAHGVTQKLTTDAIAHRVRTTVSGWKDIAHTAHNNAEPI